MLPNEIIYDIFLRLPAKSIGRFRCVSKPWRSLLTQPNFTKAHLNQTKQYPSHDSLILVSSDSVYYTHTRNAHQVFDENTATPLKLNFNVHPCNWNNGITCDGLFLIGDSDDRWLVNPITNEIRKLPICPYALKRRKSFTVNGLGYDSASDDYKVVTLSFYDSTDCYEMFVDVFSVKNGTWKRAESSPYNHVVGHISSGVFVGGCIHWLASQTSHFTSVIAGFDLAEEKFREVPYPSSVDGNKFVFNQLGVLGGCLCMFPWRRIETDIWVMKEYGVQESWTKFRISDPEGRGFRPLCMCGEEHVVTLMYKVNGTYVEKLVIWNLKQKSLEVIKVHGVTDEFRVGGTFRETLVSPYYSNERGNE